ncbi:MAG: sulfatase-like hydrolase/transferase [Alphaproteobacteria bacterium]|nr:sulfatase-like hydrolase/transferase [Alphaproteobacteria bacterium]
MGRLVDGIDPAMLGRTTVFLLGDNGTSKWGMPKNRGPGASRAKHSVFEGGVRIPLVVTGPLVKSPGTTDDSLVHIADLFPTVVDIAGLPRAEGRVDAWQLGDQTVEVDGRSLLPLLQGRPGTREYLYTEGFEPNGPGPYTQDLRAVRNGTHKLMQRGSAYGLFRIEGLWEGNDLMSAPLSPEDQAAHDALLAELDRWKARLRYEGR